MMFTLFGCGEHIVVEAGEKSVSYSVAIKPLVQSGIYPFSNALLALHDVYANTVWINDREMTISPWLIA